MFTATCGAKVGMIQFPSLEESRLVGGVGIIGPASSCPSLPLTEGNQSRCFVGYQSGIEGTCWELCPTGRLTLG